MEDVYIPGLYILDKIVVFKHFINCGSVSWSVKLLRIIFLKYQSKNIHYCKNKHLLNDGGVFKSLVKGVGTRKTRGITCE